MTPANSTARKAYWASMTPEARTKRMRQLAIGRQKKMSFQAKRQHGIKMAQAKAKQKHAPDAHA